MPTRRGEKNPLRIAPQQNPLWVRWYISTDTSGGSNAGQSNSPKSRVFWDATAISQPESTLPEAVREVALRILNMPMVETVTVTLGSEKAEFISVKFKDEPEGIEKITEVIEKLPLLPVDSASDDSAAQAVQ